jgi:hypothetical protein
MLSGGSSLHFAIQTCVDGEPLLETARPRDVLPNVLPLEQRASEECASSPGSIGARKLTSR